MEFITRSTPPRLGNVDIVPEGFVLRGGKLISETAAKDNRTILTPELIAQVQASLPPQTVAPVASA